jgi:hypothetical protein
VMGELMIADVREQVMFSLATDFVNYNEFKPDLKHKDGVNKMLDQVVMWSKAMKVLRD